MATTKSHTAHTVFVRTIEDGELYIGFPKKMLEKFNLRIEEYVAMSDVDPVGAIEKWLSDRTFPASQMTPSGISSLRSALKAYRASN